MSDFDNDTALRHALADLRGHALAAAPQQNIGRVRAIAHRRRVTHTAAIGVAAVIALAAPVAAYGMTAHSPAPRPAASPSATASATPSPTASASASPSPSGLPDGKIGADELGNATLDIPAFGSPGIQCGSGQRTFTGGKITLGDHLLSIEKVVYADVDHDGAANTIALVSCRLQGASFQVVAFGRDAAGRIVTDGQVAAQDAAVQYMFDMRAEDDGSVGVQVGDVAVCCGELPSMVEHQWRTYGYVDGRFRQVGGPTQFHPAVPGTHITTTATDLHLGPLVGGARHGQFAVTVRNDGPNPAPGILLDVYAWRSANSTALPAALLPVPVRLSGDPQMCGYVERGNGLSEHVECHLPALPVGAARTYTFAVSAPQGDDAQTATTGSVGHGPGSVEATEEQAGIRTIQPIDPSNNRAVYSVTRDA